MSATPEEKMFTLVSKDKKEFKISKKAVRHLIVIRELLENMNFKVDSAPCPKVHSTTLEKVVEFAEHHKEEDVLKEEEVATRRQIPKWDVQFLDVPQDELFQLILAANYLNIPNLLHSGCQIVANMIDGKSVQDIRRIYNIKNDFSPEREAELLRDIAWCNVNNE